MANYKTDKYEHVDCKPYKGYNIDKSYALDYRGKRIPGTAKYMVSHVDDNWIGDVYNTLAEAHQFIDEEIASSVKSSSQKTSRKDKIMGTSGRSTSKDYIKVTLFDYLADFYMLDIDGEPASRVVDRIAALAPIYDVDDVLELTEEEGVDVTTAITMLEEEED